MLAITKKEYLSSHQFDAAISLYPTTTINYSIPEAIIPSREGNERSVLVTLKVYDMLGRVIAALVNETKSPGNYEVKFNGASLPSGIYFYRLQAGSFSQTKKFVLMK